MPRAKKGIDVFCSRSCAISSRYKKETITSSCAECGTKFEPTYIQIRESLKKGKSVYCSKGCRAIHTQNKNESKKCRYCEKEFWGKPSNLKNRSFCSVSCSRKIKTGEKDFKKAKNQLDSILETPDKFRFFKFMASKYSYLYGVPQEDILQDYFLSLLEGNKSSIQQTAMSTVKNEYSRGVRYASEPKKLVVNISDMEGFIPKDPKSLSEERKWEMLHDIKIRFDEYQYKIAQLVVMGFNRREIKKEVKGNSASFQKNYNFVLNNE